MSERKKAIPLDMSYLNLIVWMVGFWTTAMGVLFLCYTLGAVSYDYWHPKKEKGACVTTEPTATAPAGGGGTSSAEGSIIVFGEGGQPQVANWSIRCEVTR